MGKTKAVFKKIGDIKGTFHAGMGILKGKMVNTEQKQKRLRINGNNTEKNYKKGLNDPDNHDDVITHTEPDILECEFKWKHYYEQSLWR